MVTAGLFDLDCTLVDRVHSIRQYALRFAEDFHQNLAPTSRESLAEALIAADGLGYRPDTKQLRQIHPTLSLAAASRLPCCSPPASLT